MAITNEQHSKILALIEEAYDQGVKDGGGEMGDWPSMRDEFDIDIQDIMNVTPEHRSNLPA